MIKRAVEVAAKAHHAQFRKGTDIPYFAHPCNVGMILAQAGCPEEVITAGILHDTIEDTHLTIQDLCQEFGARVAMIVEGCSEPVKDLPWRERKQHTIGYLKTAPLDVLYVACADKLDNARSIARDYEQYGENLWTRFKAGKDDQGWYYRGLVESFDSGPLAGSALLEQLKGVVGGFFPSI